MTLHKQFAKTMTHTILFSAFYSETDQNFGVQNRDREELIIGGYTCSKLPLKAFGKQYNR